jgi:hypothetical protein
MSEANSVRVSLVQRTDFSTPAALNMKVLATTGQSLRSNVGYAQSQTLRTDANIQDLVRLSLATSGGVPVEMQFPVVNEALWFALRAVLRATEDAERSESSCSIVAGQVTVTKAAIDFTTGNTIQVGDIVKITGTGSGQDGFRKVTVVAATTVTTEGPVWSGSSSSVTIVRGARMKNGTQRYFFDAEVGRLDVNLFELYRKLVFDGLTLTISDNALTTASFNLLGITTERSESASLCLGHADPTASPILDALGVPVFNFGGVAYSAKSIGFTIANNIRARTQIGTLGGTAFAWGAFTVTTRSSSYIANFTEINNYTGNVPSDMWFVMQNSDGKALSFSFPQHKWSDLAGDTRGLNQDDYLDGTGQAYLDPVELCTMRVQRWVA